MPIYSKRYQIPANTSFNAAKTVTLKLCPGILTNAIVTIPAGHHFLARFQVLDGIQNIIPGTEGEYIAGEDGVENYPIWYKLDRTPFELTWKLWNLDDTYAHAFMIKLIILPEDVAGSAKALEKVYSEIHKLVSLITGEE